MNLKALNLEMLNVLYDQACATDGQPGRDMVTVWGKTQDLIGKHPLTRSDLHTLLKQWCVINGLPLDSADELRLRLLPRGATRFLDAFIAAWDATPEGLESIQPLWSRLTWDQQRRVLQMMEDDGGGFVSALAAAWFRADAGNSATLGRAFDDIVRRYAREGA